MKIYEKLSPQERSKFRHDLGTIITVLKTALSMVENGDEVCTELAIMIDIPRGRLGELLELLHGNDSSKDTSV